MDFLNQSEYPGRLPEPVTLLDSHDPRLPEDDPNGVILTCKESQNAVGYQLLSGSDPYDVAHYTIVADSNSPPAVSVAKLPSSDTWWTVKVRDAYGSTIHADPVPVGVPVEDFESYTDQAGEEIFSTWIDGFVDKSSGSTVGYTTATNGTFGETAIVHGGYQSMPLDYNNVKAPFFSEAKREWTAPQNWTVTGVHSLTLYFRGKAKNGQEKLYVTLVDSTSKSATVVHPNAAAACATQWAQWKISLQSFTGVNSAKIKTLIIGLGDRSNPKKGGAGLLFIDDIWITKP